MKTKQPLAGRGRINRINPFVDWGFKFLFGREENKDLLLSFINHVLDSEVRIEQIDYINTELTPDAPDLKRCVVDVLATDREGNRYLVEMQNVEKQDIQQRLVYYACRLVDQMGRRASDWRYDQIKKVYAICLMNFNYDDRNPVLRKDIKLRGPGEFEAFTDILTIIPLQIPCIRATTPSEYRKSYEFWIYLLESLSKHMKNKQELLDEVNGFQHISEETKEKFRKVINTVEEDLTEDQWRDYELALIEYQDTIEEYHTAIQKGMAKGMAEGIEKGMAKGIEQGKAEGMAEGMAKGMAEGIEKGMAKGIEQGKAEGMAKGRAKALVETAKAMKADGVDASTISKWTGLSAAEIQRL